jgi:hypothetical protein
MKFEGSELEYIKIDGDDWFGIVKNNILLIGLVPGKSDRQEWFSNGQELVEGSLLFSMKFKDYVLILMRYLNELYPQLKIKKIW